MTSTRDDSRDGLVFVLIVTYTGPLTAIDAAMPAHRRFLDEHFAAGAFLASGPQAPRTGGVIIARAADRDAIEQLIAADPFTRDGLATYDVHAFLPTRGPFALPLRDSAAPVPA
ncbi:MAG TPA: YciI family protein [Nocardioides sp.]|uniref:YciI family protein n=1 Tax=Nocardioides sp. TaxID=35761 RepID=UPI002C0A1475|nr:YciI family protein [Nocardioides sp.]HQR25436.1 YciI family protein [Nocardioides sp.]